MTPETITLHADDVNLTCAYWRGDKAPILFLHGLGSNGTQFYEDANVFSQLGHAVIVPDLRGHGCTPRPQKMNAKNMTVDAMATDILALLDQLGLRDAHLVGNSMGGVLALNLINRAPERALSLTTFGTVYNLSFPPIVPWLQYLVGTVMGPKRLAKLTAKSVGKQDLTKKFILDVFGELDLAMCYQVQKTLRKYDYRNTAQTFQRPILLLRGDGDKEINARLSSTLKLLREKPNAKVIELADAGHFTNLDQPELVRRAIREILIEGAE